MPEGYRSGQAGERMGMMQLLLRSAFPPALPSRAGRSIPWPWRDRAGRFSPLRAVTLALLLAPAAWVAGLAATGNLGPEPWKDGLREIGLWAIRLLLVTLAVTEVWSRMNPE